MDKSNTELVWEEIKDKKYYLSYEDGCDCLCNLDREECFEDYLNDCSFEFDEVIPQPTIFVYEKIGDFKITFDDIVDMYDDYAFGLDGLYDHYVGIKEPLEKALEEVNKIMNKLPKPYECIGYIRNEDVKDIWEKFLKENNE